MCLIDWRLETRDREPGTRDPLPGIRNPVCGYQEVDDQRLEIGDRLDVICYP